MEIFMGNQAIHCPMGKITHANHGDIRVELVEMMVKFWCQVNFEPHL